MAKKYLVALDDGHGTETAGKRTPYISEIGRQIKENEFNSAVVNLLDIELKRCGIATLLVAPTNNDDSLQIRVQRANNAKADLYVAIHYDAFDSKFDGYDPEGLTVFYPLNSANSKKLAQCINDFLKEGTIQKNRGIKAYDYYVLKYTNMPAILSENGFMDNKREALLMIDKGFQKEVAVEHAKGICKYLGVIYVKESIATQKDYSKSIVVNTTNGSTVFRIHTTAFKSKVDAEKAKLDYVKNGYFGYAEVFGDDVVGYRLQSGKYTTLLAVENVAKKLIDNKILTYVSVIGNIK